MPYHQEPQGGEFSFAPRGVRFDDRVPSPSVFPEGTLGLFDEPAPGAATPPAEGGGPDFGSGAAVFAQIAGAALQAVGTYQALQAQKENLRQQSLSLRFAATTAAINAGRAEDDARAIMEAGRRQRAILTMRQGQERAALLASQGASGAGLGGSNAEVRASQRVVQEIDKGTQDLNTVRAANAARTRATDFRNQADLGRTGSKNLRRSVEGIDPALGAASSLLESGGQIASRWVYRDPNYRRRSSGRSRYENP